MVGSFGFSNTPKIHFGIGSCNKLVKELKQYGHNVLLICGASASGKNKKVAELIQSVQQSGYTLALVQVSGEPTPGDIDSAVTKFAGSGIDVVVSIGGGSVIDAGKAISAMLPVGGNIEHYLEGVGHLDHPGTKVPFIALPTSAGTGSEATKNAVITQYGKVAYKKSLRHDNFVPECAIVDPELTLSCPAKVSAAGGMDAFAQLVESYMSTKANPLTDALAISGIKLVIASIENAVYKGDELSAREDMAYAAMLSGITLANAGLGVIHGFAQPLGSLFPIPHGVVCGTLMAASYKLSLEKLLESGVNTYSLSKLAFLGSLVAKRDDDAKVMAGVFIDYLKELTEKLALPKLSDYGVKERDFETIVELTGLKNHPVELSSKELTAILMDRL